jgi:hypothetical protein
MAKNCQKWQKMVKHGENGKIIVKTLAKEWQTLTLGGKRATWRWRELKNATKLVKQKTVRMRQTIIWRM